LELIYELHPDVPNTLVGDVGRLNQILEVIESMSEAWLLMDHVGRVQRANPAAATLLECEEAELVGRPFAEICGSDAIPATPWHLLDRAPSGRLTHFDVEITTRTGRLVPISISVGLVRDRRGKVIGMQVVANDITERKQAEVALTRQAEELARSNAELEQFAYVASHDLQEPLRMMASFAQLLAKRYKDQIDADADEFIDYIVDGAARMQRLINDLLSYSRVDRRDKEFAPTDCAAVVATTRANLRAAIEESGAMVITNPLPVVMADETQLVQLFQNLLGNAIKFRGEKPVLVYIGAERRGNDWLFWIWDNGIGIEPQYVERIFLIFQRLHGRSQYPGTGIGLAIAKKIVERHAGRIWVESEPGKGQHVLFHTTGEAARLPCLTRSTVNRSRFYWWRTIPEMSDWRSRLFGITVRNQLHVVQDGVEAMSFLRQEGQYVGIPRPDLVLLDLNLPRKDGREVLAEIKLDPNLKRIPVVILTSSAAAQDILHAYNLYANCYITKPLDLEQFLRVIRSIEDFWLAVVKLPPA
jgi:PAS domain S-box-containing protein